MAVKKVVDNVIGGIARVLPNTETSQDAQKRRCEARGGTWDGTKCIMPQTPKPTQPQQEQPKQDTKVYQGNIVDIGDGKTGRVGEGGKITETAFRKLTSQEQADIARLKDGRPTDAQMVEQQARAQRLQELASQGMLTPEEMQLLGVDEFDQNNLVSNVATGGAAIGGAVVGAKFGAGVGTAVAPGIGTLVGGIIGGVGGAIGGAYTKIKIQKYQSNKEAMKTFSKAKVNKGEILNMVNAGLLSEGQARELWAEEKQHIYSSYRYLKTQTQNDLNNFIGSPGDELIELNRYLALDGLYDVEFEKALMQPNPAMIRNFMEVQE